MNNAEHAGQYAHDICTIRNGGVYVLMWPRRTEVCEV